MASAAQAFLTAATRSMVLCDIDGVLAFFQESASLAVNIRFGTSYSPADWTTYRGPMNPEERAWLTELMGDEAFWNTMAPDFAAHHALMTLAQSDVLVAICTDRPVAVKAVTLAWLDYWGFPRNQTHLVGPGGKEAIAAMHGPDNPLILIDDSPLKWLTFPRDGVEVWSPRRPYTPESFDQYPGVTVFDHWHELLDRVLTGSPNATMPSITIPA